MVKGWNDKDWKFPKHEGLPDGLWVRKNIGLELLYILKSSADLVDRANANNPKGLIKHFDIIGDIHKIEISQYKFIINMRKEIFGKEFLDECLMVAVEIYKKCDIDIMKFIGLDSKKMRSLEDKK